MPGSNVPSTASPVTTPDEQDYEPLAAFVIPDRLKQHLFKQSLAMYERDEPYGRQHIKNMTAMSTAIASEFATKAKVILEATFRLILPADTNLDELDESLEFIAISYCCHSEEWKPAQENILPGWPFDVNLVRHILDSRPTPRTGIWIDEMCIDSRTEHEKSMVTSCMDCIYRDAKMVLYVLEDLFISQPEVEVVQKVERLIREEVLHTPPQTALADSEVDLLGQLSTQIFTRRLFYRAWCFHEFTVAEILSGSWAQSQAAYKFIAYQTARGEMVTGIQGDMDLYSRPFTLSVQAVVWLTLYLYHARGWGAVFKVESSTLHAWLDNNWMSLLYNMIASGKRPGNKTPLLKVFLHIITLDCTVLNDLVPISLNSVNVPVRCKVSLKDKGDFLWFTVFLALVSGDPCALTSMGWNLRLYLNGKHRRTWLYVSSAWDPPQCQPMPSLEGIGLVAPECIELDLIQFRGPFRTPELWALDIAGKFVERYYSESNRRHESPLGSDSAFKLVTDDESNATNFNNATMVVAMMVERGLDWTSWMWKNQIDSRDEQDHFRRDVVPQMLANPDEQLLQWAHEHLFNLASDDEMKSYKDSVLPLLTTILECQSMTKEAILGTVQFTSGNTVGILRSKRVGSVVGITNMFDPEDINSGKLMLALPSPLDNVRFQHLDRVWVLRPVTDEEWDPETFGVVGEDESSWKADQNSTCDKANSLWRERKVKPDWRLVEKVQLICPRLTGASFPDNDTIVLKKRQLIVG